MLKNNYLKMKFLVGFIILILGIGPFSFSRDSDVIREDIETITSSRIETFTFSMNKSV